MTIYRDLIQFEPIVEIKVLTESNSLEHARDDVRTFVVSDPMREILGKVVVPHLRYDEPGDHKAIFVVATYGTGKTHLMSVISSVAERAELLGELANQELMAAVSPIAGKFRVIRAEIGSTRMSLRDIVCRQLEEGLKALGVSYGFAPADQTPSNKDLFVEMMQAFEAVHPEQGLLFVLDELLDYLRSRKDLELTLDLAFLREAGEICRSTRFRFIAGVQESLFDNPRFANVAAELMRVRERYEQLRISREDVSFVVQERLLKKNVAQRDTIREYLTGFTSAFEGMAEHLEDFVSLFPVHPAYLKTFERISIVEKRKVLSTLSDAMTAMLDSELPADEPGLICYDSYRRDLDADPSNRTIPEVREVLDKTGVLRARVDKALPTREYKRAALRIIDALAVNRLTTIDIYTPIGVTLDELRDDLCLLPAGIPERDPTFIRVVLESILDEILRAVSGQFITVNPDNDQIYLDVRKDVDYDQKIETRAESLDENRLDEAYFRALEEVLEQRDAPYVAGYRIWKYSLPWTAKNTDRVGYLFFGAPNERSTAQPPRDFYIYFLQPYGAPEFVDEQKPDEVFFRLDKPDDEFKTALRIYAGADALARESTVSNRGVYEAKRNTARDRMVAWLKKQMATAVTVTHSGSERPLGDWLPTAGSGPRRSVKDQVDAIAAGALAVQFDSRYPGYPKFEAMITRANLGETLKAAVNQVVTGRATLLSGQVLLSLSLADLDGRLTDTGPFAKALLASLVDAGGRAVNRSDLLHERDPGVPTWGPWHLEPQWLLLVAAVCCQLGRLEIGFPDGQIDATMLEKLTRMTSEDLAAISLVAPPKPTPVAVLRSVAELLGLDSRAIPEAGVNEAVVRQIHSAAETLVSSVAQARAAVAGGVTLWGALVVDQQEERDARLESLQKVLDNVLARDSVGKLNKLNVSADDVAAARRGLNELKWVSAAMATRDKLSASADYLRQAADIFGGEDSLAPQAELLRGEMLTLFSNKDPIEPAKVSAIAADGVNLVRRYADEAARAHARDRLDLVGDERKRQIIEGDTYKNLKSLSAIELLPGGLFGSVETRLVNIGSCKTFDESHLSISVVCPECGYRPQKSEGPTAAARIEALAAELQDLRTTWERTLLDNLSKPEIRDQIPLLGGQERAAVEALLTRGALPDCVDDDLVRGINRAFNRFAVRRVSADELWKAVFPAPEPSTLSELKDRFSSFLASVQNGEDPDRVRVLPSESGPT
jgi:hypothetical protein